MLTKQMMDLKIAAVAYTIQMAIEAMSEDAQRMRDLKTKLIAAIREEHRDDGVSLYVNTYDLTHVEASLRSAALAVPPDDGVSLEEKEFKWKNTPTHPPGRYALADGRRIAKDGVNYVWLKRECCTPSDADQLASHIVRLLNEDDA